MSSDYAAIRAAAVAALETVANIGEVYAFRRFLSDATQAKAAFITPIDTVPMIQFADVEWVRADINPDAWQSDNVHMRMAGAAVLQARIYRSLKDADASGLDFAVVVEDAMHALARTCAALTPRQSHIPVVLEANDHRVFSMPGMGDVLVHYAQLSISPRYEAIV